MGLEHKGNRFLSEAKQKGINLELGLISKAILALKEREETPF